MDDDDRRRYGERLADMQYHLWRTVLVRQSFIDEAHNDEDGFRDVINLIVNDAGFSELLYDRDREAAELVFHAAAAIITREIQKNRSYGGSAGQEDYVAWNIDTLLYRSWTPEQRRQREHEAMQAQADEMREQEKAKRDQEKSTQCSCGHQDTQHINGRGPCDVTTDDKYCGCTRYTEPSPKEPEQSDDDPPLKRWGG